MKARTKNILSQPKRSFLLLHKISEFFDFFLTLHRSSRAELLEGKGHHKLSINVPENSPDYPSIITAPCTTPLAVPAEFDFPGITFTPYFSPVPPLPSFSVANI